MNPPPCDLTDPAHLSAWYGPFSFFEPYRKVTISHCREACRAACAAQEQRVTEARLDDLAHLHPEYLEFLTTHLKGRIAYEMMTREEMGVR
jgi:hypothetical protein